MLVAVRISKDLEDIISSQPNKSEYINTCIRVVSQGITRKNETQKDNINNIVCPVCGSVLDVKLKRIQ